MKYYSFIFKFFIYIFSSIVKRSKAALKYLFTKALKSEVEDFCENQYYRGYLHINKAIDLALRLKLTGEYAICDVGGSDGKTSVMFANNFPTSKIFVFEPIKKSFSAILELVHDKKNVIAINKAAGNEIGKTQIHVAQHVSSSSIFDLQTDNKSEIFSNILQEVETEEIVITTLDQEISPETKISILKLDVQGFELEVLKGAVKKLEKTAIVLLEMNNHNGYKGSPKYFEIDDFLRKQNFTLYDIFPSTHDKSRLVEWDCIYLKSNLL